MQVTWDSLETQTLGLKLTYNFVNGHPSDVNTLVSIVAIKKKLFLIGNLIKVY